MEQKETLSDTDDWEFNMAHLNTEGTSVDFATGRKCGIV